MPREIEGFRVRIANLPQFERALKQLDTDLVKELRSDINEATQVLAREISAQVPIGKTGRARASVQAKKATSLRAAGSISAGGRKAPYYPWLDFGGKVGRKKATVRPFTRMGRYIFPVLKRRQGFILDTYQKAIEKAARKAGFN